MIDELEPIHKAVEVDARHDEAFRRLTDEIGRWWPLRTHSVGGARATGCYVEGGVGGGVFETGSGGEEHRWGTIMAWEPPERLAFTWHPGRDANEHTLLEVSFTPVAEGRTRVALIHSGWQAGDEARHRSYEQGWDQVLKDHFAAYVARTGERD